jgi:hypothetical protein
MPDEKLQTLVYEKDGELIELGKFTRKELREIKAFIKKRRRQREKENAK